MMINKIQKISLAGVSMVLLATVAAAQTSASSEQNTLPQTSSQTASAASTMPVTASTAAPMSADQLDALVAPIALYPDALVAQVLGAAAAPDQVAIADYWVGQNKTLTGAALAQAVDLQTWDPSVKALTQFPSVLDDLAGNLAWASSLGQAFQNQQADVMAAVQVMRAKAQAAGTLQSTPQIKVVQQDPQTIVIQPAIPDVVYVPQYNPTVVYGMPYVVPLYRPRVILASPIVSFGLGIRIGGGFGGGVAIGGGGGFAGGGFSWGWHSWNCNWGGGGGGGNVVYQHNTYVHNTTYINNHTSYNNYHPWGPGPHGSAANGPHPYSPNGFRPNGGYGPNGGRPNGGVLIPNSGRPGGGNEPNGGHPVINGGPDGDRYAMNGGPNGDRGVHNGDRPEGGNNDRGPSFGNNQPRNQRSGDGGAARAEANRGRASMQPRRQPQARPQPRPQARGNAGGRRR
jgi:hypothetical protein